MNILALDTSMGACSAAVLRAGNTARGLFARETLMARGHAEALMPMIAEVMEEAGLDFAALDLVAATTGPGSFTGVRIAVAGARGLALVTPAKLYGIDSLTVMARSARSTGIAEGAPLPSRSMPGAACSISGSMTTQVANLTARSSSRLRTPYHCYRGPSEPPWAALLHFSPKQPHSVAAKSKLLCPSFNRAPLHLPRSRSRAAKPFPHFARFIFARRMPGLSRTPWHGADAHGHRGGARDAARCPHHGRSPPELFPSTLG